MTTRKRTKYDIIFTMDYKRYSESELYDNLLYLLEWLLKIKGKDKPKYEEMIISLLTNDYVNQFIKNGILRITNRDNKELIIDLGE